MYEESGAGVLMSGDEKSADDRERPGRDTSLDDRERLAGGTTPDGRGRSPDGSVALLPVQAGDAGVPDGTSFGSGPRLSCAVIPCTPGTVKF